MYPTFVVPHNQFIDHLRFKLRFSPCTCTAYDKDLEQFLDFVEGQFKCFNIAKIDHKYIRAWKLHLINAQNKGTSVNRKLASVRKFFKFLSNCTKLGFQVEVAKELQNVEGVKIKSSDRREAPVLFVHDVLDVTEGNFPTDWEGRTDRMCLILLYNTGIRVSELCALNEGDVSFSRKQLKVLGKGGKERLVVLNDEMLADLKAYIKGKKDVFVRCEPDALLLTRKGKRMYSKKVYLIVERYLKSSPHALRHACATHMLRNGANLAAVKDILGHSTLASTQHYTDIDLGHLIRAHQNAHPTNKKERDELRQKDKKFNQVLQTMGGDPNKVLSVSRFVDLEAIVKKAHPAFRTGK